MKLMTIPDDFKWIDASIEELNALPEEKKIKLLKKEEIKIRQSIGEAVPTNVFFQIAENIKCVISQRHLDDFEINKTINKYKLKNQNEMLSFLQRIH